MSKYVQFGIILLVCLVLDQWTKQVASARLASQHRDFDHAMVLPIGDDDEGKTVEAFLGEELERNSDEEVAEIARRYARDADGNRLRPDAIVTPGSDIHLAYRKVVVVPGYFDFEYTRNPGAAFGFMADTDSPLRVPFFVIVSLIAVLVIIWMLRGVDRSQQLTIWSLSFIAGGAIGNFIDRIAYGWVIDFIVWKYTDEFRWPTFNIADAFITTGVAMLVLDMILDARRQKKSPKVVTDGSSSDDEPVSAVEEEE